MKESFFLPKPRKPIPDAIKKDVLNRLAYRLKFDLMDLYNEKSRLESYMVINSVNEFSRLKNIFLWFKMLSLNRKISKANKHVKKPESALHEHNKMCSSYKYISHAKIQHI